MGAEPFGRLDNSPGIREKLLPHCRLQSGDIWEDKISGHKVGVLDATKLNDLQKIFEKEKASLAVQDPPYNVVVGERAGPAKGGKPPQSNLKHLNVQSFAGL